MPKTAKRTSRTLVIIRPDADEPERLPVSADDVFEESRKALGFGYAELVPVPDDPKSWLVVDEEGRMKRLPINLPASHLAQRPIVGTAVLVRRAWLS